MINESGEFISPPEPIEAYMPTDYQQLAYCVYGFHHVNGKEKENGSITSYCKGNDIISNMHDTKLGKVCTRCITLIPKRLRLDKEDRLMPKE